MPRRRATVSTTCAWSRLQFPNRRWNPFRCACSRRRAWTGTRIFIPTWCITLKFQRAHNSLLIESRVQVETHWPEAIADDARFCPLTKLADALDADRCFDFLQSSRYVELEVDAWRLALDAMEDRTDVWQAALALMRFTHGYLKYQPNSTHVHTQMRDVIAQRSGVCQDFAHFLIGLCRSVKIPARYVSGYLATETASATHAWTEIFLPELGWRGLDPTHNRQIDETYVKIGHGRDYADVPPVSGNYHGTLERTMTVEVRVNAVRESDK